MRRYGVSVGFYFARSFCPFLFLGPGFIAIATFNAKSYASPLLQLCTLKGSWLLSASFISFQPRGSVQAWDYYFFQAGGVREADPLLGSLGSLRRGVSQSKTAFAYNKLF